MRKFLYKLRWIGFIGFIGFFTEYTKLRVLCIFSCLFFLDNKRVLSSRLFLQSIKQIILIPLVYIVRGFKLPVRGYKESIREYSFPVDGEWLVVNGGINKKDSHSWGMPTQRYAYDFLVVDDKGKTNNEKDTSIKNYYCYGMDIISPDDGVVVRVCDKYNDARILGDGEIDCTVPDMRGNHVVIKHHEKEYSALAHLQMGTITVSEGDVVKRGQRIAKCGNSGTSTEPHLHFQIQDGKSFFASAGKVIRFKEIGYIKKGDTISNS